MLQNCKILKLAIFDWAGTIVDIGSRAPIIAFQRTFEQTYNKFGIKKTEDEIFSYMGMDKKTHLNNLTYNKQITDALYPILVSNMGHAIFEYSMPVSGIQDVFSRLKDKGYLIGSTSGYSRVLLNIAIARAQFEGMSIPFNITSDEVSRPRPYNDMIEVNKTHFLKQLNTLQHQPIHYEILKIGDTLIDIEEGINSKCKNTISTTIVGITKSDIMKEHMISKGANHVFSDIKDIITIV